MTLGRPPYYENVEDLQKAIDDYFVKTPENRITITGLTLHLGFNTRQSLIDYEEKPEFIDTIKRAKLRVEHSYECDLKEKGNSGTIFALKNFNWRDKTETELTGKDGKDLTPTIVILDDITKSKASKD